MDVLPSLPKAGELFRRNLRDEGFEKLLLHLFLIGLFSVPVTAIVLTFVFRLGHATLFSSNDPHSGWVDDPDTRGTFNVIWICLSTIFTCVYVSVHVGIPELEEKSNPAWRLITNPAFRKVIWLLFNIFAPELMVLVALCELQSAIAGVDFMRRRGQIEWKTQHAFFADTGGFKLSDGRVFRTGRDFYAWFHRERPELNYKDIETDIRDRSKANTVLKLFTCAQAIWFLIETILRFAEHLPVSELEVTTCTYIVCAVVTYVCWLRKPYGVNGRITLHINSNSSQRYAPMEHSTNDPSSSRIEPTPAEERAADFPRACSGSFTLSLVDDSQREKTLDQDSDIADLPRPLFPKAKSTPFNRAYKYPNRSWFIACHISSCVGASIGIFHAVTFWNAQFVNTRGQWVWRACCIVQIMVPVALVFVTFIEYLYAGIFLWIFLLFLALVYCIARAALFALIWLSFKSLPDGVYRNVHWTWNFVPSWN